MGPRLRARVMRGDLPADDDEGILRPVHRLRATELVASSMILVVAGVLLARGFIGLTPGRPVFVVLGVVLAATAILGLAADHVAVHVDRESPESALNRELNRSRRNGHDLAMVRVPARSGQATRIVARLRTTDLAWRRRGALIAVLTETDRAGAERFLERIDDLVDITGATIATFPADALTADGLQSTLRGRADGHSVGRPTLRPLPTPPDDDPDLQVDAS